MPRYFIEVYYKGTNYSGFQIQQNANSIQAEIEKVLGIFFKRVFTLTGSSRTDAGVHALQNYFHFDIDPPLDCNTDFQYNLNALLPGDIGIRKIFRVKDNAHCRFDAISREYKYFIHLEKDPFLQDIAFYFPYRLDIDKLNEAARLIMHYEDFTSFSKRNTQVKDFLCAIHQSRWYTKDNTIIYHVVANRFLRGMVKGLVGTMLSVGRNKMTMEDFRSTIESRNPAKANFSPPSRGLFLVSVKYPTLFFND